MVTFEWHRHFIYGKGNTKHPNASNYKLHRHKKRLHSTIWILKVEVWSGGFGKQRMACSSCDSCWNLDQMNCRWNNCHVPFPLTVAFNFIYHCGDGEIPWNMLILKWWRIYFWLKVFKPWQHKPSSTATESDTFIFSHCVNLWKGSIYFLPWIFFVSGSNVSS